jgi:S1-C subfamily serine protease
MIQKLALVVLGLFLSGSAPEIRRVFNAVVEVGVISLDSADVQRTASGWWYKGKVITAGHLFMGVEWHTIVTVVRVGGEEGELCDVTKVEHYATQDIAILTVSGCDPPRGLRLARKPPVEGQRLCYTHTKHAKPEEVCSEVLHTLGTWVILADPTEPGHSGSPLYDDKGRVVGIISRGNSLTALAQLFIRGLEP